MKKTKAHSLTIDELLVYLFWFGLFVWIVVENGLEQAINVVTFIIFFSAGWFIADNIINSIRTKRFSFGIYELPSLLYYFGFCTYWIVENGISQKALILTLPLLTGLLFVSGILFSQTTSYKKINSLEKGIYKKVFSYFRKKHNK